VFTTLPGKVVARMRELGERDARDRADGTPQLERLRQIPPETGRFLAILCAQAPAGRVVEIGTSAGYSTLWLALACRATRRGLTTYEVLPAKAALARETFAAAEVNDVVDLVEGDFLAHLDDLGEVAFCFLDAEKDLYDAAYAALVPHLVPGGLLVADNVISHAHALQPLVDAAEADPRVDAVVVPIGKGELLCRRI
jgi:caffeoyl-CoA O-methyltransferase